MARGRSKVSFQKRLRERQKAEKKAEKAAQKQERKERDDTGGGDVATAEDLEGYGIGPVSEDETRE